MPLVALGASKLTGDPTRFKESYTANHPLLPPPVAPPCFLSPPQVCYVYIEDCYDYAEDCYVYNEDRYVYPSPPCSPSLFSCPLRFAMSTPRIDMSTPRIATSTPRTAQVVFTMVFYVVGPVFSRTPPHWICHRSLRPLATTLLWLGE